jgi:RNA polymerase sigma factor (sigma-70 family)
VERTKRRTAEEDLPALWDGLRPALKRVLWRFRIPPEDAEDLVQRTLLLAVTRWQEIECPQTWLLGTLHNTCIDYVRRRRRNIERQVDLGDWEPQIAVEWQRQEKHDRLADIDRACRKLPMASRKLVLLRFRLGLTICETANAMGLAPESVRKATTRALERLRVAMGHRYGDKGGVATQDEAEIETGPDWNSPWSVAVSAYVSGYRRSTRKTYGFRLLAAGAVLDCGKVADVTEERLREYRVAVLADGRKPTTQTHVLCILRGFLLWACNRQLHALEPALIRAALSVATPSHRQRAGAGAPLDRVVL